MRKAILSGTFASVLFCSAAAAAQMNGEVVLNGTIASLTDPADATAIADVKPGDELTITGACVVNAKSAAELRVMLTLANRGAKTGYHVLATDQTIGAEGLNVRVPDLPEIANRDFNVRIFRVNEDAPQMCNAGTIHVGAADHLG